MCKVPNTDKFFILHFFHSSIESIEINFHRVEFRRRFLCRKKNKYINRYVIRIDGIGVDRFRLKSLYENLSQFLATHSASAHFHLVQ